MWQAPGQRSRAIANQKKKERERNRRPLHIRRVKAELKVSQPMVPATRSSARLILNDFTPKGVGLFSENALLPGQEVAITIEEPRRFYVKGRVIWCQEHNADSHIMSSTPFSYRIGVEFIFDTPEEKIAVEAYCEDLFRNYIFGARAA